MFPSIVKCRRLLARYSFVAMTLCMYTIWTNGTVPSVFYESTETDRQGRDVNTGSGSNVDKIELPTTLKFSRDVTASTASATMDSKQRPSVASPVNQPNEFLSNTNVRLPLILTEIMRGTTTFPTPQLTTSPFRQDQLIVHVTWFYQPRTDFRFHEAMCLLSIQRFVHPKKILFWYDKNSTLPVGPWWHFARQSVAHLLPVPTDRPTSVYNQTVSVREHQSDVVRIEVLEKYGGLYVDLDVIIVRPIDDLVRAAADRFVVVMGAETPDMLGSGFILAPRPGAQFLAHWHHSYARGFNDSDWNGHSVFVPMQLALKHPDLVHVEWFSINRPNWNERRWLYEPGALWDWSSNYAVHLWYRNHPATVAYDPVTIRQMNTTTGEILRHIYYEHPDVLPAITTGPILVDQHHSSVLPVNVQQNTSTVRTHPGSS